MKIPTYIKSFFYCNYFYGICAVALAIEASLQQHSPLNPFYFYIAVFCATVWFYTIAYSTDSPVTQTINERNAWYHKNKKFVRFSQRLMLIILIVIGIFLLVNYISTIPTITVIQWLLILLFPVVGILYYGITNTFNLRNVGWLKPFLIGFSWAGIANVYPIVYYDIVHNIDTHIQFVNIVLFVKNFMFVTVLCIMFDIKDYADDYNRELKTFVVKNGLRKTIFYILIPLSLIGLGWFLTYAIIEHYSLLKIFINTIPFISMIAVAYSMHQRKPILYYLVLIDGLMLLKAVCGSIAMIYF